MREPSTTSPAAPTTGHGRCWTSPGRCGRSSHTTATVVSSRTQPNQAHQARRLRCGVVVGGARRSEYILSNYTRYVRRRVNALSGAFRRRQASGTGRLPHPERLPARLVSAGWTFTCERNAAPTVGATSPYGLPAGGGADGPSHVNGIPHRRWARPPRTACRTRA